MKDNLKTNIAEIFDKHNANEAEAIAKGLRHLWLQFEPKSTAGIKAEDLKKQKNVGIPVKVLRTIGGEVGKRTRCSFLFWYVPAKVFLV